MRCSTGLGPNDWQSVVAKQCTRRRPHTFSASLDYFVAMNQPCGSLVMFSQSSAQTDALRFVKQTF